jgi:hypothetical protein
MTSRQARVTTVPIITNTSSNQRGFFRDGSGKFHDMGIQDTSGGTPRPKACHRPTGGVASDCYGAENDITYCTALDWTSGPRFYGKITTSINEWPGGVIDSNLDRFEVIRVLVLTHWHRQRMWRVSHLVWTSVLPSPCCAKDEP